MYCIIKYIVQGKQVHVKNADLRQPSCKSASPVLNVLKLSTVTQPTSHSQNFATRPIHFGFIHSKPAESTLI